MKFVSGDSVEEKRLVTGLQAATGRKQDNSIGPDTLVGIAQKINPGVFPLDVRMFNCDVFVGKNIIPFDPNGPISKFNYCISGSYSHQGNPSSILIHDGRTICGHSAHEWLGYPDSVIYELYDGTIGICRVIYDTEIPNRKNVKWAIGGAGLLDNFDAKAEGYCKFKDKAGVSRNYSDVWRKTNHTVDRKSVV